MEEELQHEHNDHINPGNWHLPGITEDSAQPEGITNKDIYHAAVIKSTFFYNGIQQCSGVQCSTAILLIAQTGLRSGYTKLLVCFGGSGTRWTIGPCGAWR